MASVYRQENHGKSTVFVGKSQVNLAPGDELRIYGLDNALECVIWLDDYSYDRKATWLPEKLLGGTWDFLKWLIGAL